LKEAKSLHPDTSDIFELHKDLQYNEGAAHWHIKAQDAMDSWGELDNPSSIN
jgi:hypothetical protein